MIHDVNSEDGHPLRVLRTQLDLSQKDFAATVGVSEATISRAENGHRLSPKVRHQLCDRLGKTSEELGLMGRKREVIRPASPPPRQAAQNIPPQGVSTQLQSFPPQYVKDTPTFDIHKEPLKHNSFSEQQQEHAWLTVGASSLGQLFNSGWSFDEIIESVKVVLQGVEGMPSMMRQNVLWSNISTLSGSIPFFTSTSISEDEKMKLSNTLSKSIATSWKLFLSANNAQLLALGQTQLALVQQVHPLLHPSVRAYLYTGVYGLIGLALHFQERDLEALQVHQNGYFAASSTGDAWYVVQSLICQADCYNALRQYDFAIKVIQEALWIINTPTNNAQICAKAHLLSCWADNAMMLDDYKTAQEKLAASEEYLDQIVLNEEFDRASWLLLAGKYALKTENYITALRNFESALVELPEQWTLRRAMTALGLTKAYARIKERDKSLEIAQNLAPMIQTINAKMTNRWFAEYLQHDLLDLFPTDAHVRTFVSNTYQQLPQLRTTG